MNPQPLNPEGIRAMIRFGQFTARLPTPPRNRSQVYRYIERIYRTLDDEEIQNWFRCSWCMQILYCVTRNGTTTLIRHLERCASRPNGVVGLQPQIANQPQIVAQNPLINAVNPIAAQNVIQPVIPAPNPHEAQVQPQIVAQHQLNIAVDPIAAQNNIQPIIPAPNPNIHQNADVGLIPESNDGSNVSQNAAVPNAEMNNVSNNVDTIASQNNAHLVIPALNASNTPQHAVVHPIVAPILTPLVVAEALAKATQIGMSFGIVSVEEFESIIPKPNEPW